jgi:hypothetical protein
MNMPLTLLSIFQGKLKTSFTNKQFLESKHSDILKLKHLILKSGRCAFHYAVEAFVLGEMDLPDGKSFEVSF